MQRCRPVGLRLVDVGALGDEFERGAAVAESKSLIRELCPGSPRLTAAGCSRNEPSRQPHAIRDEVMHLNSLHHIGVQLVVGVMGPQTLVKVVEKLLRIVSFQVRARPFITPALSMSST